MRGVEREATQSPFVVEDPDMKAYAMQGRQGEGGHAPHVLVVVRVEGIMDEHPQVRFRW